MYIHIKNEYISSIYRAERRPLPKKKKQPGNARVRIHMKDMKENISDPEIIKRGAILSAVARVRGVDCDLRARNT